MDVVVTRKYKGVKDEKGSVGSVYNYNQSVVGGSTTPITIVNNYYTTPAPEGALIAPTFNICIDFKALIPYEYKSINDMVLTIVDQEYEISPATLSIEYGTFIGQFDTFIITPTALGMIILKGEFKL